MFILNIYYIYTDRTEKMRQNPIKLVTIIINTDGKRGCW